MTTTGQKKISIYDPLTGTVVQLNNISEQGEFVDNPSFIRDSKGGRMFAGDDHKAEFMSLDGTGYDQLETWMKARTKVRFVTYGLDEHILWYEDTHITVKRNSPFSPYKRSGYIISFERQGGIHSIYKGSNILFSVSGWKDSDLNNVADGWGSNGDSHIFTNNQQTFNKTSGTAIYNASLVYPISGVSMTFLFNTISQTAQLNSKIEIKDFGAVTILNQQSGVTIHQFTTPANTYTIAPYIVNGTASNFQIIFEYPYLGIQKTSYSKVNY